MDVRAVHARDRHPARGRSRVSGVVDRDRRRGHRRVRRLVPVRPIRQSLRADQDRCRTLVHAAERRRGRGAQHPAAAESRPRAAVVEHHRHSRLGDHHADDADEDVRGVDGGRIHGSARHMGGAPARRAGAVGDEHHRGVHA